MWARVGVVILLCISMLVIQCNPCPPCECLEEKQTIAELTRIVEDQENMIELQDSLLQEQALIIEELEAQLPCPECECPACPECPPVTKAEEFKNLLDLKVWLREDKTDETWVTDRDRNRIAVALQKAALEDGYIISVYPYRKSCPAPKHYLLNLAVVRDYTYSIDASTDEVTRYLWG